MRRWTPMVKRPDRSSNNVKPYNMPCGKMRGTFFSDFRLNYNSARGMVGSWSRAGIRVGWGSCALSVMARRGKL